MRPTVTITVFGCLAEMTTPTFVLRRKRRHPVACSPAGVVLCATVAAVRLRTVTALRAVTAAAAALVPAVRGAAAALACAIDFVVTAFLAAGAFAAGALLNLSAAAEETRSGLVDFARAGLAVSRSVFFLVVVFSATTKPPSQRARLERSGASPSSGVRGAAPDSSSAGAWPA